MNKSFKVLLWAILLSFVFVLWGNSSMNIKGTWDFEKAEYMERQSPTAPYQVKRVIEKVDELSSLEQHFSVLVRYALFMDEIAFVHHISYGNCGRYIFLSTGEPEDKQVEIVIGNPEEIGLEYNGMITLSAPGLRYLIDKIDDETIGVTFENIFQEDTVTIFGAVRCILKKVD